MELGAEVFPFAAAEISTREDGSVKGCHGDMGVSADGEQKASFEPGLNFTPYTIFAEGCRGHLGKELSRATALMSSQTSTLWYWH